MEFVDGLTVEQAHGIRVDLEFEGAARLAREIVDTAAPGSVSTPTYRPSVVFAASTTAAESAHGTSCAVPVRLPSRSSASATTTVSGPLSGTATPASDASHIASRSVSAMGTAAACPARPLNTMAASAGPASSVAVNRLSPVSSRFRHNSASKVSGNWAGRVWPRTSGHQDRRRVAPVRSPHTQPSSHHASQHLVGAAPQSEKR